MQRPIPLAAVLLTAAALAAAPATLPARAQTAPQPAPSPAVPSPAVPATPTQPALPGVVATTNNPNLAVATIKLESGTRAGKIIGSAVQNEGGERIGSIDDLILSRDDKVIMAIVSVGGFLGLGSKLVAVPWSQLRMEKDYLIMPGATKDGLNAMPNFTYG